MMSKKCIIYILPHHDDECFVIPRITQDLKAKHDVRFFFLMDCERRFEESKKFLTHLGVASEHIKSLGKEFNTQDGHIYLHLDSLYEALLRHLANSKVNEIICTAYEGGHHDHDAASSLSRALAIHYKAQLREFYLYHGHGTTKKFYKVASPINCQHKSEISYGLKEIWIAFIAPFFYTSQFSAMLGLWPFLMLKILLGKPLVLNTIHLENFKINEHSEVPLYERWRRIDQKKIFPIISKFIYNHLPKADKAE